MSSAPPSLHEASLPTAEWISISEASPDELLRGLPLEPDATSRPAQSDATLRRRARLGAMRSRMKQQRDELRREFARLRAERAKLELERAQFALEREHATQSRDEPQPQPQGRNSQPDADRMTRLFRSALGTTAPAATGIDSAPPEPPVSPSALHDEHHETAASVSEYMDRLLGRIREKEGRTAEVVACADLVGSPSAGASVASASDSAECAAARAECVAISSPHSATPRRKQNVDEIRAAVGSLRELANHSARAAVKKHSARKFRKTLATIFPLTVAAFVLGATLVRMGGNEGQFSAHAYGTMMLGVIAGIELIHSFWRIHHRDRHRGKPANITRTGDDPEADADEAESD